METFINAVPNFAPYALHWLANNWQTVLGYLLAGGGVSTVLQFIKRLRKWDNAAWIQSVLFLFSALAALSDYIINDYATSPLTTTFGNIAPKIFVAALVMHRVAVSPLFKLAEKGLEASLAKFGTIRRDGLIYRVLKKTPAEAAPSPAAGAQSAAAESSFES